MQHAPTEHHRVPHPGAQSPSVSTLQQVEVMKSQVEGEDDACIVLLVTNVYRLNKNHRLPWVVGEMRYRTRL